jgi:hypothetical protein
MIFNIPQFIDIEDKIVGPLTAKQLGWLAAGAVCALLAWTVLDFAAFILAAIFFGIFFGLLAFYKPNGQPLVTLIGAVFIFVFKPKIYMWKRVQDKQKRPDHQKIDKNPALHPRKNVSLEEIEQVSQLLEIRKK